jgi:ABC-type glycerol-3-phosphate transport system substrate-binding protein
MISRYTRRQFLRVAGLTGGAAALAACAAPAAVPAAPEQPAAEEPAAPAAEEPTAAPAEPSAAATDLRYAMWDWYAYAPGVSWDAWNQEEAFPQFESENPGIKVAWEPLGDGWEDKVLTQMAAGAALTSSRWSRTLTPGREEVASIFNLVDSDILTPMTSTSSAWEQMRDPFTISAWAC